MADIQIRPPQPVDLVGPLTTGIQIGAQRRAERRVGQQMQFQREQFAFQREQDAANRVRQAEQDLQNKQDRQLESLQATAKAAWEHKDRNLYNQAVEGMEQLIGKTLKNIDPDKFIKVTDSLLKAEEGSPQEMALTAVLGNLSKGVADLDEFGQPSGAQVGVEAAGLPTPEPTDAFGRRRAGVREESERLFEQKVQQALKLERATFTEREAQKTLAEPAEKRREQEAFKLKQDRLVEQRQNQKNVLVQAGVDEKTASLLTSGVPATTISAALKEEEAISPEILRDVIEFNQDQIVAIDEDTGLPLLSIPKQRQLQQVNQLLMDELLSRAGIKVTRKKAAPPPAPPPPTTTVADVRQTKREFGLLPAITPEDVPKENKRLIRRMAKAGTAGTLTPEAFLNDILSNPANYDAQGEFLFNNKQILEKYQELIKSTKEAKRPFGFLGKRPVIPRVAPETGAGEQRALR